ncbi:hypothetical protein M1349_03740 [Patescibacteria group bacterium]|nr:hypothetical protein [Patescibacteria group bacterium]
MPKRTTLLIIILAFLTVVLVYFAVAENNTQKLQSTNPAVTNVATSPSVKKTAKLYFDPAILNIDTKVASPSQKADLVVDTGTNKVTGVQMEATFDPKVISNIQITNPTDSLFPDSDSIVLFKDIDYQLGRISYAVGITPNSEPKTGVGKVATITFSVNPVAATQSTSIGFLEKSMVSELDTKQSVLKESTPLQINFVSQQVTQPIQVQPTTAVAQ